MTPIGANIVGPPVSATRISDSIADAAASCSAFGNVVM
jgi:hypothetical protein